MNLADNSIFHRPETSETSPDDRRFRLIYHGTLAQRYGIDLALKAVNLIRHSARDVLLIIHGGGEYQQTLERLTEELGLQEHVQFSKCFIPTVELPQLLRQADLAIVPYRDGVFTGGILPTKLLEYAALGIPAIAARTPAILAYFDETAIRFFTPGNADELAQAILELYHNRARLATMAHNIEKFNARYNWPDHRTDYLRLIERMARRRGS
jgi:glycosyltransferase involved in cell wall biosynthesis